MKAERRLEGLGISPGIAIGPVFVTNDNISVPEYRLDKDQVEAELERFAAAVALSTKQLRKLKTKADTLPGTAKEEVGYLLDAHLHMLGNSRLVRGAERRIESERMNAERAVMDEIAQVAESFAEMGDAYLAARVDDIRIVGARLVRNLTKTPYAAIQTLPEGTVILA
ncbi:MAG TPA: phosphoenolpyruvate-utilizing N-terminal domain-containing protein, partial [Stellaceae bacterium]|nr:phosphoenolpyruvate-utilizing N-terminal domain-containing protein [Stellaceae bacterium]